MCGEMATDERTLSPISTAGELTSEFQPWICQQMNEQIHSACQDWTATKGSHLCRKAGRSIPLCRYIDHQLDCSALRSRTCIASDTAVQSVPRDMLHTHTHTHTKPTHVHCIRHLQSKTPLGYAVQNHDSIASDIWTEKKTTHTRGKKKKEERKHTDKCIYQFD